MHSSGLDKILFFNVSLKKHFMGNSTFKIEIICTLVLKSSFRTASQTIKGFAHISQQIFCSLNLWENKEEENRSSQLHCQQTLQMAELMLFHLNKR